MPSSLVLELHDADQAVDRALRHPVAEAPAAVAGGRGRIAAARTGRHGHDDAAAALDHLRQHQLGRMTGAITLPSRCLPSSIDAACRGCGPCGRVRCSGALLTSTSMRPQRSSTCVTDGPSVVRSVMSADTDIAWRPSASTSAAVLSSEPGSGRRVGTLAPSTSARAPRPRAWCVRRGRRRNPPGPGAPRRPCRCLGSLR